MSHPMPLSRKLNVHLILHRGDTDTGSLIAGTPILYTRYACSALCLLILCLGWFNTCTCILYISECGNIDSVS